MEITNCSVRKYSSLRRAVSDFIEKFLRYTFHIVSYMGKYLYMYTNFSASVVSVTGDKEMITSIIYLK